jgi:quinol monooxygenase YgiN
MIFVIATIELADGKREAFLKAFHDNVPNVLAEDGCLEYTPAADVATDIAAQPAPRENVVTVIEKWRDLAALQAHLAAPHMAAYREQVKEMVRGATLHVLEPRI